MSSTRMNFSSVSPTTARSLALLGVYPPPTLRVHHIHASLAQQWRHAESPNSRAGRRERARGVVLHDTDPTLLRVVEVPVPMIPVGPALEPPRPHTYRPDADARVSVPVVSVSIPVVSVPAPRGVATRPSVFSTTPRCSSKGTNPAPVTGERRTPPIEARGKPRRGFPSRPSPSRDDAPRSLPVDSTPASPTPRVRGRARRSRPSGSERKNRNRSEFDDSSVPSFVRLRRRRISPPSPSRAPPRARRLGLDASRSASSSASGRMSASSTVTRTFGRLSSSRSSLGEKAAWRADPFGGRP